MRQRSLEDQPVNSGQPETPGCYRMKRTFELLIQNRANSSFLVIALHVAPERVRLR
jgi:hypothetical protein